jgi:hypothetical protein
MKRLEIIELRQKKKGGKNEYKQNEKIQELMNE